MPDPVDVVTHQVRGFIAAAMAEAIAAERLSARAAELERVRQVANKLLGEPLVDPPLTASQAFDELFRRLASDAPVPTVSVAPDERAFDRDFLDDRGRPISTLGPASGVLAGEPGGPFEDNSPEAIAERARLELERRASDDAADARKVQEVRAKARETAAEEAAAKKSHPKK